MLNGSGPEASRCARIIRPRFIQPASGQCFRADPHGMRIGSGMFTGLALMQNESNDRGRCAGFLGSLCETNINDCRSGPCQAGAQCVDWIDDFYCRCPPETFGKTCGTVVMATSCLCFSHTRILRKRLTNHSPDCSVFSLFFIFFKAQYSLHTPVPHFKAKEQSTVAQAAETNDVRVSSFP